MLQTAVDHNTAFHRDPFLTSVLQRVTHITLVAEGKGSLAEYGTALTTFATFGKDNKVDEIMLSGHGDAKAMEMAADKGVWERDDGQQVYGLTKRDELTVDRENGTERERVSTDSFFDTIKSVLRDDPGSRIGGSRTASDSRPG